MQNVRLVGDIGQKFGETWSTDCEYVIDIFKHISCQRSGFRPYLIEQQKEGGVLVVTRGEDLVVGEELFLSVGSEDIIIGIVPAGASGPIGTLLATIEGWFATTQIGIQVARFTAWQQTLTPLLLFAVRAGIYVGLSLAVRGITNWLAPGAEGDDNTPEGYFFVGAENNIKEGVAIPVLYGELMVGGAVINNTYTTFPVKSFQVERNFMEEMDSRMDMPTPGPPTDTETE